MATDSYESGEARKARFDKAEAIARRLHDAYRVNEQVFDMRGRFPEWDHLSEPDRQISIASVADLILDGVIK